MSKLSRVVTFQSRSSPGVSAYSLARSGPKVANADDLTRAVEKGPHHCVRYLNVSRPPSR